MGVGQLDARHERAHTMLERNAPTWNCEWDAVCTSNGRFGSTGEMRRDMSLGVGYISLER